MRYDALILGGGPAGLSAALTLRARGRSVAVISGRAEDIPLYKADRIANYPGCPNISGRELLSVMRAQTVDAGAKLICGRATTVMEMGNGYGMAVGADYYEGRCVILCTGVRQSATFPGERELLGHGVSYCVTCDGALYKGKRVCVIGHTSDAEEECELLRRMGCVVELFTEKGVSYSIRGQKKCEMLVVNGEEHPCRAVFILRPGSAPDTLMHGLAMNGSHVAVKADMSTELPGVFAAGDCVGRPYQAAKAVGEGNVAALTADRYLDGLDKAEE